MKAIDVSNMKIQEQPVRAVLYGEAGGGKTHLLRDFPKPLLLYDFDGKYEPLIGVEGIHIKSYVVTEKKDCKKQWLEFWNDWKKDKKDPFWATIAMDSLTSLDSILWTACIQIAGYDPDNKSTYERFLLPLYGDLRGAYDTLFSSMRSCKDKNVLVLAHENFRTNDSGTLISISPLMSGGMKDMICAIFKDTWYLEVVGEGEKIKRKLHYKKFKMRTCSSVMMNGTGVIEAPTYAKIVAEFRK